LIELLACTATLSLLPPVQEAGPDEAPAPLRFETVVLDWPDHHWYWARLRLPGDRGTVTRAFQREGLEPVEPWPPHESWTIEFLNNGSHTTVEDLRTLCPLLKRVGAPGIEILQYWELSDEAVRLIAGVPSLERVHLGDLGRFMQEEPCTLTVDGLRQLAALPRLRHLYLGWLEHFTDEDLAATLELLPRLETLRLRECAVDTKTVRAIAGLESLRRLSLADCWGLGDDDLRPLAWRVELEALNLHGCSKLTGRFVDSLRELEHLRWLDLGRCDSMEGRVLERLAGFPELEYLNLHGMRGLTDEGLRTVSTLPRLKALCLPWCYEIDDRALQVLASSPSLERIGLYKTGVTDEGIATFRQARPECEVALVEVFWGPLYERW